MAIPFEVSSEEELDQLFAKLYENLQQIHRLARQRASRQPPTTISRVRSSSNNSRRFREEQTSLSELMSNSVVLPSSASSYLETVAIQQPRTFPTPRRRKRRRTSSTSSSSCEECKICGASSVEEDHQVWTQVGVPLLKMATDLNVAKPSYIVPKKEEEEKVAEENNTPNNKDSCQSESIFSKLVPELSRTSIWTAVICVVGWHLLSIR